jgi:hypothetical protein
VRWRLEWVVRAVSKNLSCCGRTNIEGERHLPLLIY